jgi:hypothetical protein
MKAAATVRATEHLSGRIRGLLDTEPAISRSCVKARVSFVPHLGGLILKMLIRRGVADSGIRNRNAQVI